MTHQLHLTRTRAALVRVALEAAYSDCRRARRRAPPGSSIHREASEVEAQYRELLDFFPVP